MENDGTINRRAGNLPHWRLEGALYFVTFRLTDAIPVSVAKALKANIETDLAAKSARLKRDLTPEEISNVRRNHAGRAEQYLDAGHGTCLLNNLECRRHVAETLKAQRGYGLDSYVVMPNHVHALIHPDQGVELSNILRKAKSFSATTINPVVGRRGRLWQRESFDHIVRTPEKREQFRRYIADNPGKANLAEWDSVELFDYDVSNVVWPNFDFRS